MANRNENRRVNIFINTEANEKQLQKLSKEAAKLEKELSELPKETDAYIKKTERLSQVTKRYEQVSGKLSGKIKPSIKDLSTQYRRLNNEIKNLTPGTNEFINKSKQLSQVRDELKKTRDEALSVGKSMQKTGGKGFSAFMQFGGRAGAVGLAATALLGLGKQVIDIEEKFNNLAMSIKRSSGVAGDPLLDLTSKVQSLSDVYGEETNEIVRATNALSKQMGISFEEAFNLVEKGFLNGANASGDFLDKVKQYPIQFKNAGLSAEQFIQIATQEVKGGVYDDKLLDSVKELGLRMRELTPAAEKALAPLGKEFSKNTVASLRSGSKDVITVFKEITEQAQKMGLDTQQVQTIIADLGGGALEDAGGLVEAYNQINQAINLNLDDLDELGKKQKEQLDTQKQLNNELARLALNFKGTGSAMGNFFNKVLAETTNLINRLIEAVGLGATTLEKFDNKIKGLSVEEIDKKIAETTHTIEVQEKLLQKMNKMYANDKDSFLDNVFGNGPKSTIEDINAQMQESIEKLKLLQKQRTAAANNTPQSDTDIVLKPQATPTKSTKAATPKDTETDNKFEEEIQKWKALRADITTLNDDFEQSQAEADERELARIAEKYSKLKERALEFRNSQVISEQEYNAEVARIDENYRIEKEAKEAEFRLLQDELKKEAQTTITQALMSENELEVLQVQQKYEKLIALAEQFKMDTTALQAAMSKEILAIQSEQARKEIEIVWNKRIEALQNFSSALGNTAQFMATLGAEAHAFQKAATLAQIMADTASAISSLVKNSHGNPANAVSGGLAGAIQFGTGIAQILANVGKAKQLLSSSETPQASFSSPKAYRTTSFFKGGFTGDNSMGFGDKFGDFAGLVHKNEFVVSENSLRNPFVLDTMRVIDAMQSGSNSSIVAPPASNSSNQQNPMNMDALLQEMRSIKMLLEEKENPIIAIGERDIKRLREEIDKQKKREDFANLK